jgi:hypothetical protein
MTDPIRQGFDGLLLAQDSLESTTMQALVPYDATFFRAYGRLLSLNAWRQYLLVAEMGQDALGFFIEAQNDSLVALLLARKGMWRTSLQCLRSAIENIMAALYFRDHPVEYELWKRDEFRIGFAELKRYFEGHPRVGQKHKDLSGLDVLGGQYRVLSKAVHGSGVEFRMTKGVEVPVIFGHEKATVGRWDSNQRAVFLGLNLLLITFFRDQMAGTAHSNIRSALGQVISPPMRSKLKSAWKITIPAPV